MSVVNFNQKQWRQDFAAYVQDKLGWSSSRVTKSKVIKKAYYDNSLGEHITSLKEFRVINGSGNEVKIQYYHDCVVGEEGMFYIDRDFNLVYEYLKDKKKLLKGFRLHLAKKPILDIVGWNEETKVNITYLKDKIIIEKDNQT